MFLFKLILTIYIKKRPLHEVIKHLHVFSSNLHEDKCMENTLPGSPAESGINKGVYGNIGSYLEKIKFPRDR